MKNENAIIALFPFGPVNPLITVLIVVDLVIILIHFSFDAGMEDDTFIDKIPPNSDHNAGIEAPASIVEITCDSDPQEIDIVLPDCTDLDWAQITYALNFKRLMSISNYKTWIGFLNENLTNSCKYMDYTAEQLCHRFLQRVLPNIYDYELKPNEEYLVSILGLHPNFKRTEQGFILSNGVEALNFPTGAAVIKPLMTKGALRETGFQADSLYSNEQIIISNINPHVVCSKFNFNEENAALLSVVLSSDEDLPNSEVLKMEEIHKRLKAAKNNFEFRGQQLKNVNISVDDMCKKLKTMCELKAVIVKLLEKTP